MTESARGDYAIRAHDGLGWISGAHQLLHAAQVVADAFAQGFGHYEESWRERQVGLMKATMLLTGLAVENAFKGLAAATGNGVAVSGDRLPLKAPFSNHDLLGMATRLKVDVDPAVSDLLMRLSQAILWGGRYPIPLRETGMPKDGVSLRMLSSDMEDAKKLVAQIHTLVRAI